MKRQTFIDMAEAAVVWMIFHLFRLLPVDQASAFGGWVGRVIGYRLPVSDQARKNLERALPELDESARERVIFGMWDNLGRTAAEFPHLDDLRFGPGERVEIIGGDHLVEASRSPRGSLFFSGHLGNWELNGHAAAAAGITLHLVYRAPDNPRLRWLYERGRAKTGVSLIPKGAQGARQALMLLRKGEHLGLLVDQKMNDGIAVPFFGRDAMTAPALADLALKFDAPIIPARVVRLNGARFRLIVEPALVIRNTGDRHTDVLAIMSEVNAKLERWIREHPEQWLWVHRRWPG
jgi:KDO2-lipid IV(A) lauroyltransferase